MSRVESGCGDSVLPHPPPAISSIAVIGAGAAGRDFAIACAAAGYDVVLEDVMPANLRRAQEQFAELVPGAVRGTLQLSSTIEAAVRNADLVVDFVPDELESKLEIFCLVDRMAPPRTAILTPSDALSITDLASCTYRGERCFAVTRTFRSSTGDTPLRLLHPPSTDHLQLQAIAKFLRDLGYTVHPTADTETPILTKNLR